MVFFWKLQISKWFPIWNNCVPTGFTVKMTKLQLPSFHKRRNHFLTMLFTHMVMSSIPHLEATKNQSIIVSILLLTWKLQEFFMVPYLFF